MRILPISPRARTGTCENRCTLKQSHAGPHSLGTSNFPPSASRSQSITFQMPVLHNKLFLKALSSTLSEPAISHLKLLPVLLSPNLALKIL